MSKLGYSSITLTDLTETLPVSLVLESNLDNYFQTKTGNLYVPNFENGEGVIITPSLYLGQEDLEIEKHPEFVNPAHEGQIRTSGFIYYKINEEKYWFNSNTDSDNKIFVDELGRLHIQKNLSENITIEAFIEDLYNKEHNYTIELVQTSNPINFLFLEEGINQVVASIECLDGREHFEDRNAGNITMIPTLYQGNQILNYTIEDGNRIFDSRFSYSWSKISGEVENSNQAEYIVERQEISNREYFTCTILDSLTGLTYTASQFIQDFTDIYNCSINYDKALIFTDKETKITLTAEVYFKNQKLNEDPDFELSYNWEAIGSINNKKVELFGEGNILVLNNTTLPEELKNQNFIIYCSVFQTDSSDLKYQIAGNYLTISYSSDFTIKVSPQTIFIPTSSNGDYLGQSSYSFNFQLVDEENNFIKKIGTDSLYNKEYADAQVNFTEVDKSKNEWNFIGNIQFNLDNENSLWKNEDTFRTYEFSYQYLGKIFTEQILIVKNIVGTQGFSGYTIDLSNDFVAFAGEDTVAKPGEVAETEVTAYYGSETLKIESIDIGGQYLYGKESASDQIVNNILIHAEKIIGNDNKVKITLTTGSKPDFTSVISPIHFNITIKDPIKSSEIVFRKTFNYTINYNGKTYSLFPSAQNIIYKANNTYEPSQIAVSALVKEISGEPYTYEDGKIIYSFDGGIIWKFLSEDKIIKDYLNLDNIIIRLYSNLASFNSTTNITEATLNENARYLLDIETIPVLTSLEGTQIGGENLLPWTKSFKNDFNLLANKWWGDKKENEEGEIVFLEELAIIKEGDFNTLEWESPWEETDSNNKEGGYSFYSPKILLETEYLNSQFCLSCDIYVESLGEKSSFSFIGRFFKGLEETEECIRFGEIEKITMNGPGERIKVQDENWRKGEWNRISMVFSLEDLQDTSLTDLPSLESCKYFSIQFNLLNSGKIKIKKPKLELGNIATSWSTSPSDLDYSNFEGANLILPSLNTLKFQPEEEITLLASNLTAGIYTCSWKTLEISDSIDGAGLVSLNIVPAGKSFSSTILQRVILPLIKEEVGGIQTESKQVTFNISSSFDLYLFNQNSQVTFSNFKFERGEKATDYMLTETLADAFIQHFQDNTNEIIGNILILDANGRPVYITPEELQQSIGEVTTKISETEDAILDSVKTSYLSLTDAAPLQQIESSIHLGYDENNRGYLQISTMAGFEKNNYMKLTDYSLDFYSNNVSVASLSQQTLTITDAKIANSLQIGKIKFMPSDTDGLAVIWEG